MAELLNMEGMKLAAEFSLWKDPTKPAEEIEQEEFLSILGTVPTANNGVKVLCEDLLTKEVYQIQEMSLCQGNGKEKACTIISFGDKVCVVSKHSRRDIMPLPIARFYWGDQSVLWLSAETEVVTLFG